MSNAITARTGAKTTRRSLLACALATALTACGGGGSGGGLVVLDPPPAAPPPVTPPPPPVTPPPTVVQPPNPAYSGHLADTNTFAAHEAGFTGRGVRIGFIDSGVNRRHPALRDRVVANLVYIGPGNNLSVDDVSGHGTAVAQIAAGRPFGTWPGGVAQNAEIVSARIIGDKPPEDDGSGAGNEIDGPLGLEPIHRDLINRNVKVMNNSWGGLYWTNLAVTAQIAAEYRPFIVNHGGLVVFASGNAGFANPSDTAALPSKQGTGGSLPAADLERGWITVSALAEGSTTALASYSNACGVAMRYCLVAPGTVIVTGTDNPPDQPDYWRYSGTSLAAPLVSGAAALVWEAFPYFNNDLVRQTLLGTATDIGAAGVDPVFGYGVLDVGKAVLGPAKFDWGDVTANFSSGTSTWGNDIRGNGGLVKRGGGTLRLSGDAGYAGATRAEGGTLAFVSSSIPGAATVESGATLQLGGSRVGGDLVNRGTFAVTGNVPARTIAGNFQQADSARLAWQIGAPLQVTGTASLAGELQVTGIIGGYTLQRRETVVEAVGGITGRFGSLTRGPGVFLEGNLRYDTNLAWIDVIRLDVTATAASLAGITPQSLGAAQRVEGAFEQIDGQALVGSGPIADGFIRTAGAFQGIQGEAAALAALDSLSGAQHAAALTTTFDNVDMGRRVVASRVGALAASGAGTGLWQETLGQGGSGGFARDGFSVDGWSIGRDHRLGNGLVAGFAFGELRGDGLAAARGDRNRDRQTQAQAYLARSFGNSYVMAQLGSGRFDRDMQRQLFAGAGWQGVSTRYAGSYTQAAVEAGHYWQVGAAEFGPYLGAEQVRLRSDGFDERGGDGFGLRSSGWDVQRSQAIAGLRARWDAPGFSLHGYGEWQQTLSSSGFDLQASFTGIEAWAPIAGLEPARSGGLLGLALESWLSPRTRMMLGLDQRFGPRGSDRMASMQLAYGF
ncbi:autotransporter domain-containing protein [Luteimonas chenhongjianii]|uniref:Autotransporter domain-containing protein n=1 Tax=Luteimonas chenhongjianii TaxID=2006110 RepID=A0A290XI16_9GAMM|nr:autotransporter serine protease [Luteimonas chenhongjianii]ATD68785.1 autotransporter domain-containing protein [Luteimonas chenhongjianii]